MDWRSMMIAGGNVGLYSSHRIWLELGRGDVVNGREKRASLDLSAAPATFTFS